jgi:hypothetical protein
LPETLAPLTQPSIFWFSFIFLILTVGIFLHLSGAVYPLACHRPLYLGRDSHIFSRPDCQPFSKFQNSTCLWDTFAWFIPRYQELNKLKIKIPP